MSRILLVEDGRDSAPLLLGHLQGAGHEVEQIEDGAAALERILSAPPALTLLEVVLPRIDGIQVLEKVRSHGNHPIIMLTARAQEADRLLALDLGADDYVCKPFSPREVVARIHTVLRRHAQWREVARPSVAVRFDDPRGNVCLEGRALRLTRRELLLLRALSRDPGRVFTRSKLLEAAFAEAFDVNERAVDGHIKNLRKKLADAVPSHDWIRSVYGVGFCFAERPA
ncbi:response regulator transcription factor [Variovorax sp. Root411]|uniref:response regulator transcription factor n=1 Tax=Variovorax sp. Root411 TaxID=1736530 RepID=UPI0006FD57EF|nr:response regulator transcription factor [Variovorax sp. Root411]KQW60705.1 two-component system response regulator [Variovorax sp. Root411]